MSAGAMAGWSVMGTGTIATERMVSAIRAIGHHPLWVVSRSRRDATDFAGDLEIPNASTNLAQVLRDPSVNFSYVSARLSRRPHYISAAANAGKHVLCDGPIAATSKAATALVDACRKAGVVLAVNQPFRASSIHQTMQRLIADDEVGAVQSVLVVRGGPHHAPPQRRTQDPEDMDRVHFVQSADDIDLVRFLTGADPVEVSAMSAPAGDFTGQLAYAIRLDSDAMLQVHDSARTTELESLLLVAGERGALIANGTLNGRSNGTLLRRSAGKSELVPLRERDPYVTTASDFVHVRKQPSAWLAQGDDSVKALTAAEAVARSARKGRSVTIEDER